LAARNCCTQKQLNIEPGNEETIKNHSFELIKFVIMERQIHWAILGPGKIAHKFADAFTSVPQATLYAIASRDAERGKTFAAKFNVPKQYTQYEDLWSDPEVDAIYIATPHTFHHGQTIQCLNNKKAVLCEKPLTLNFKNASEMVATARANNTFLMEGMWSRFFPATIKTLELIRSGVIGEVKFLRADFGFAAPFNSDGRIFNLALGGGAQLDVGVYPMFLALLMLGKPDKIQVAAQLATTGADETTAAQFHFRNGSIAHILSSIVADTPKRAEIIGSLGTLTMHTPWHKSLAVTVKLNSGEISTYDFPFSGFGFQYELEEVTKSLLAGKKESDMMPLDFSLLMAEVADEVLKQAGVRY
jgi:predicted dehydrogenase